MSDVPKTLEELVRALVAHDWTWWAIDDGHRWREARKRDLALRQAASQIEHGQIVYDALAAKLSPNPV